MKHKPDIYNFSSITQLMRHLELPAPLHPFAALIDYSVVSGNTFEKGTKISLDFYKISFKSQFSGQVKYGQGYYDFDEGGLAFLKPKQIVFSSDNEDSYEGYALYFHPNLIRNYPLGNDINQYGFFSYAVSEALFLSAKEKNIIKTLFSIIAHELENNIDQFSQDVLVSQIELLLNYSNRFYNRQFITRKTISHEIITTLDSLLHEYFIKDSGLETGLPSIQYASTLLNLSPRYLSDLLRSLTGKNTQQYIQSKIIEQSKDLLSSTSFFRSRNCLQTGF